MKTLNLDLGARSYDILVGEDLFGQVAAHIPQKKTFIITDENVAALHLQTLENALESQNVSRETLVLPAGEQTKSFQNLEKVTGFLLEHKVDRGSVIIALGGGVIGDLVGFAASITLRGIGFIQIPTTLLAQVDSSVGGKTAINSAHGKNLIGSFYQPKLVVCDIATIATLGEREFLSGYAEVVKYGLINQPEFFDWLDSQENLQNDKEALSEAIYRSCQSKAQIVAEDETEKGKRALLNLGHTFGHALEAETGFSDKLYHGEAVALGMLMAFKFSVKLGICPQEDVEKITKHYEKTGLPSDPKAYLNNWDVEKLIDYMRSDKKVKDGKMVFILAKGIGQSFIEDNVDETALREFLESYQ